MSAYAAAYAQPPPSSSGGKGTFTPGVAAAAGKGGYSSGGLTGKGGYGAGSSTAGKGSFPSGGKGSFPGGAGAPTSFAPPGSAPGSSPPAFTYSGLGGASGWPSAEQLVASVPVRPFEFTQPAQKIVIGNRANLLEHRGVVPKPFAVGEEAEFFLLKGALSDGQVAQILATGSKVLGAAVASGKCREVDETDRRPRFALDLVSRGEHCCDELTQVLQSIIEDTLLPYVRQKYNCPSAALETARFRRFVPEERRFVAPHHEHRAFALLSIGLQDPASFTGGPFVQGSGRAFLDRKFVPLGRGDVMLYRSDLHHGVEVQEGSRYELVLFFKDSRQAVVDATCPWHLKAAEAGDASAQFALALSYLQSEDYQNARSWLDKSCAQDHPEALHTHADLLWEPPSGFGREADTARALQLLRRAAELGHGRSQSRLGGLLAAGVKGRVQQDTWEGKRLLRLAFEQDDPDAGFHLGQALLQEGDRDGATKLLAACAKGHPRACFQVAEMYREGQYQFPKDVPQSLRYTKWSAHQGDPQAMSNLGHLLVNGMGVVRDEAKAVRLFRHAAKLGAMEGELNYGLALLRGNGGVKVDYQEALSWAQKSAAQGHTLAQQQLPMFFNAAKNPNPPARSLPSTHDELKRLGVKELRDLLRSEGIDFSDCVEKADLIARAAQHLPGVAEPWDPAPEHTLILEPPKRSKADLLKARQQQTVASAPSQQSSPAPAPSVTTAGAAERTAGGKGFSTPGFMSSPGKGAPATSQGVSQGMNTPASSQGPGAPMAGMGKGTFAATSMGQGKGTGGFGGMQAPKPPAPKPPVDDDEVIEFDIVD